MRVSREALETIAQHAREARPNECCGILLAAEGDATTVTEILPAENVEPERPDCAYLLDHHAQLAALDMEIEQRTQIAGYYHSHPEGDPSPSRRDIAEAVPDAVYLICGMAREHPEFAAWRLTGEDLTREYLEVADG